MKHMESHTEYSEVEGTLESNPQAGGDQICDPGITSAVLWLTHSPKTEWI